MIDKNGKQCDWNCIYGDGYGGCSRRDDNFCIYEACDEVGYKECLTCTLKDKKSYINCFWRGTIW